MLSKSIVDPQSSLLVLLFILGASLLNLMECYSLKLFGHLSKTPIWPRFGPVFGPILVPFWYLVSSDDFLAKPSSFRRIGIRWNILLWRPHQVPTVHSPHPPFERRPLLLLIILVILISASSPHLRIRTVPSSPLWASSFSSSSSLSSLSSSPGKT